MFDPIPNRFKSTSGNAVVIALIVAVVAAILIGGGFVAYNLYQNSQGGYPGLQNIAPTQPPYAKPGQSTGPSAPNDTSDNGLSQDDNALSQNVSSLDAQAAAVDSSLSETDQSAADLQDLSQ